MSAIVATLLRALPLRVAGLILSGLAGFLALGLPDLDRLRELLRKVQEMLALGGMALATVVSLVFILVWVLSHLESPKPASKPLLSTAAIVLSMAPVALTGVAAIGTFIPFLAPYVLQAFALAVLLAAIVWSLGVAALLVGGKAEDLSRARKAILLAGTPWYCLAVWLSTFV